MVWASIPDHPRLPLRAVEGAGPGGVNSPGPAPLHHLAAGPVASSVRTVGDSSSGPAHRPSGAPSPGEVEQPAALMAKGSPAPFAPSRAAGCATYPIYART